MKKYAVVSVVVVLFIFASLVSVFADDIVWDDIGRGNLNLRTVLVNPDKPQIIYVGSTNAVLKSEDGGGSWRNILSVRGQNKEINFLLFDPKDRNSLYAATGNGLFYSSNQGKSWSRIFKGKNSLENECTTLAVSSFGIYLGTKQGLFVSKDNGRYWHRGIGKIGKSHILAIAYNLREPNYIYISSVDGVFMSMDSGQSWERIFVTHPVENGNDKKEDSEDQDEEERVSNIRYIICDPKNVDYLYLATAKGVYKSIDRGKTWDSLSSYGLLDREVKFLLISPHSIIYAATKAGVFKYEQARWHELSFGLIAEDIRSLAIDDKGNLYAACSKGLFRTNKEFYYSSNKDNPISLYFKDEPQIYKVQEAAIRYAEVGADKIKEWRKKAKTKAILPKLTVGIDRSESTNYEIYTSATTKYVYEGPYDKSNGWDVTLSWDLGDLIWNKVQNIPYWNGRNLTIKQVFCLRFRYSIPLSLLYF